MMEELLMDALGELDEALVEEHLSMREELALHVAQRKKAWRACISVAASAIVILGAVLLLPAIFDGEDMQSAKNDGIADGNQEGTYGTDNDESDGDSLPEGDTPTDGEGVDRIPDGSGGAEGGSGSDEDPYDFVLPEKMPEHFKFSLVWGTYGISSYDSETGELIKTTDATNPEDYRTTLHLEKGQLEAIYQLIYALDVGSYPDLYDPFPEYGSDPSYTIILTVYDGVAAKPIECREIAIPDGIFEMDAKAKAFIETYRAIRDILTETEEWQALPEYENFYD